MSQLLGTVIKHVVTINRSRMDVYNYWHDWRHMPSFAPHLMSVEPVSGTRTRWTTDGFDGPVRWETETVRDEPGSAIAWETAPGADVEGHGLVEFVDGAQGGTQVSIYLSYDPPMGVLGNQNAEGSELQVAEMMRRLKRLLEGNDGSVDEGLVNA